MFKLSKRWILRFSLVIFMLVYTFFCVISMNYITCQNNTGLHSSAEHKSASYPHLETDDIWDLRRPLNDGSGSVKKDAPPCLQPSPRLVGRLLHITRLTDARDVYNETSLRLLKPGGFYTPSVCTAIERVAIIIPYRDRLGQLQTLVLHLHTFLQRQQLQYAIYVVEMAYPTQFNRGLLANVGYLTAKETLNFTCYVIHDVDLLPADDRNLYRCSDNPRHLSVSSGKYEYKLPYGHYVGGVVAMTPRQFRSINGFSNAYFGWGREDDDLYKRISKAGYRIERPRPDIGVYEEIPHSRDFTNPDNPMKDGLLLRAEQRMAREGANQVLYNRLALEYRPIYTWVYVNTSEIDVMKMVFSRDPMLRSFYARLKKTA